MKLVIDASVAVAAAANPIGFHRFRRFELIAPPLMQIEATSTLHAMQWRGEMRSEQTKPMLARLLDAPVHTVEPAGLMLEAWAVADEMGWAKTYDANYVALARMSKCKLVTIDARLRRATARMGFIIGPTELDAH